MNNRHITCLALLTMAAATPARAHFLWGEIKTGQAAAQPAFRLTFSEDAGESTDADLLKKIEAAKAWTLDGVPLPLSADTGALSAPLKPGVQLAAASQTWGVIDRTKQGRGIFLLRYYAKAAVDEASAADVANLPVELAASHVGDQVKARVTEGGKPAANAEVYVSVDAGEPKKLTTDADGDVAFAATSGTCHIRAMVADVQAGVDGGKSYSLVRNYSTLTFPVTQAALVTTSPATSKADPQAWALLKAAHDSRETFADGFGGLTADVSVDDNGTAHTGTLEYSKGDDLKLAVEGVGEGTKEWLNDQVGSFLGHRRGGNFAEGEGTNPITFGVDDHSPLGRLVELHDGLKSSYRVKDNKVVEVTRTMGGQRFTITVLETIDAGDGKYLPKQFVVTYFDEKTGVLQKSASYTDGYEQIEGFWIPTSRRVVTAENGGFVTRIIALSNCHVKTN